MKRTALVRKTPLRSKPVTRTAALRRSPPKARRRANFPSTSEHDFVLNRDRDCMAAILFREHKVVYPGACRNRWGEIVIVPTSDDLVYGHARLQAGGRRPPSDDGIGRMFAVAECDWHNFQHWEARTEARLAINERLDRLYPDRRANAP